MNRNFPLASDALEEYKLDKIEYQSNITMCVLPFETVFYRRFYLQRSNKKIQKKNQKKENLFNNQRTK